MPLDPLSFLKSSFLKDLLEIEGLTDLSYNGESIYFVTNKEGRRKSSLAVSNKEVGSFLRQIANHCERQFSYLQPMLDVSFGPYRLNAVNSSLARSKNEKTYTFSLRIETSECVIKDDSDFFDEESRSLLLRILAEKESLVIGGLTSSGKTELEKWCLLHMPKDTRVIVIDNVEELDMLANDNIDLTTWIVNEQNQDVSSFSSLVRNALRNNPDYIIVAEARGEEMLDALTSAMSGHSIITTIHAKDIDSMPDRIARLAMMGNQNLKKEELLRDIGHHLRYYAYVAKEEGKSKGIVRYLKSVSLFDEGTMALCSIYERKDR